MKIFYSWQSDLPNASNRGFIEKALENVAKTIRKDRTLDIEPVIDRDTAGVSGAPEIVGTIFSKIEQADVFACDISIINGTDSLKPSPNPNILVELGYALKVLGEERVIMILNRAFGDVEMLPFDLRTRRVLSYNMPAVQDERATERKELESSLETAIRAIRPRLSLLPDYKAAFGGESDVIRTLAFEQPPYWEYMLTVELLKPKMKRLQEEYAEVRNSRRYIKASKASNKEYFKLIQEKMIDLRRIVAMFEPVTLKDIPASWGASGTPGDAFEIKKATDRFVSMCSGIVEWEIEISAVHPPEVFENLKTILQGATASMLREAQRFVDELSRIFANPDPTQEYAINLVLDFPEGWVEKATTELDVINRWVEQHPYEWNNE